ncbi:glycosyltransferase [Bacteroides eggerthii]|jgi:similar to glycosyltransferase|uniref:glycosyltransferase n=1 Tax=Bacteroides eggerthii TaxID=28111 RepID=UPI003219B83B
MKRKILLYSDCFTFGGSEYVAVNILKSKTLQNDFDLFFAYRYHEEYQCYLDKIFTIEEQKKFFPLKLFSNDDFFYFLNRKIKNNIIRYFCKFPFYLLDTLGVYYSLNRRIFNSLLNSHDFDLIHINNGGYPAAKTCLQLAICAHRYNIKNILQINNRAVPCQFNKLDQTVQESVTFFLTATEYAKQELALNRHFDLTKITTLYNAVDIPIISTPPKKVRKLLNIDLDSFVLIEVALLQERKGQIQLLQSLLFLKEINPKLFSKIRLILIGNGENEKKIRDFIKENKLNDKVFMLGYKMDYANYINAADLVLLPSTKDEDMPLTILSSMALSKPIISTNIAGIPEEVVDGYNGYLVNPDTKTFSADLGKCIEKAYDNISSLGINSYERYKTYFTRDIYDNKLKHLYYFAFMH